MWIFDAQGCVTDQMHWVSWVVYLVNVICPCKVGHGVFFIPSASAWVMEAGHKLLHECHHYVIYMQKDIMNLLIQVLLWVWSICTHLNNMKVKVCTPSNRSYRMETKGKKGKKSWHQVPMTSPRHLKKRCMQTSPPVSPTIQPVQAPPLCDDHADHTYELDQQSLEALPLPHKMESHSRSHTCYFCPD